MPIFKARILWAAYIICVALIFFYILFPSEMVKEYLAEEIRQIHPGLTLEIGRLRPHFPPGLALNDVSVYHLDQMMAELDYLKIFPDVLSLFMAKTHLSFEGRGYGGTLKGQAEINKNSVNREMTIGADLADIQVKQLEALSAITTHKISGNLDGTLTFNTKTPYQGLSGDLILKDGQIEFSPPVLNQNLLSFSTIETELMLNEGSLTIQRCQIEGNQLYADVSGSIEFGGRFAKNILNLSGTVRPHASLLAKLGKNIPQLFAGSNLQNQGLPFRITGSTDSLQYSFN
jgi:type II secretion system protein N